MIKRAIAGRESVIRTLQRFAATAQREVEKLRSANFAIAPFSRAIAICWKLRRGESLEVKGACEILGLDPLYVANEGKLLAFVPPDAADRVFGEKAAIIGEVVTD